MNILKLLTLTAFLLTSNHTTIVDVPTASPGASVLSEIESKARQIEANEQRIAEMNRLMSTSIEQERQKLAEMSREVSHLETNRFSELLKAMNKKRDEIENNQTWINRRNSAQSGWKEHSPGTCTAGGPPPICPRDHWYRVSVQEAMQEYNRMLQEELSKFSNQIESQYDADLNSKRNALQQFQYGENEFVRRRNDWARQIAQLRTQNDNLKQEIERLSRVYRERIVQGTESLTLPWARNLMGLVAEKHFFELRIDIARVRISDLKVEQSQAVFEARKKVDEDENAKIVQLDQRINQLNIDIATLETQYNIQMPPMLASRRTLDSQLIDVRAKLINRNLRSPEEITQLEAEQRLLEREINDIASQISSVEASYQEKLRTIRAEIQRRRDESWRTRTEISTKQQQAEDRVNLAFSTRDKILNDAISARVTSLRNNAQLTRQRMEEYNSYMLQYDRVLDNERNRLLRACQTAGASCHGADSASAAAKIWSDTSGCVQAMENMRNHNTYYGCDREAPLYQQAYNGHVNGLSDSDIQAAQRSTTKTRFNDIINSIN